MQTASEQLLKVSDLRVDVPGGTIFVRKWIPTEAASSPIILLHDSLGSVELWRDFPAALAQATQRIVIAYDRLGFGKSSPRSDAMPTSFIDDEARFVLPVVLSVLGIQQYVLFGHSVGGAMALTAAAIHDDKCVAVISESAQAFIEEQTLAGIRKAKLDFEDEDRFAKLSKWHGERARWVLDAWTGMWLSPGFRHWTLNAYLPQIRCPLLAIHGDSDEYGSSASPRHIVKNVNGPSRINIISDCGHVPHREQQDAVILAVRNFFREYPVP